MEQELGDPRRVLSLDYAQNVRDLGGYSTADGRTTAWGRCVRSGDMDQLSIGDRQALVAHGVDTVIDLRMEKEIAAAPNRFQDSGDVHFVIHDFWGQRFDNYRSRNKGAPPEVKLADLYCQGLVQSAFVMAAIMRTVAAADGGVAFHCRSGKDRTGLVAAFLLDLAGVPRTVICEDYGLTAALLTSPDADKQLDLRHRERHVTLDEPLRSAHDADVVAEQKGEGGGARDAEHHGRPDGCGRRALSLGPNSHHADDELSP